MSETQTKYLELTIGVFEDLSRNGITVKEAQNIIRRIARSAMRGELVSPGGKKVVTRQDFFHIDDDKVVCYTDRAILRQDMDAQWFLDIQSRLVPHMELPSDVTLALRGFSDDDGNIAGVITFDVVYDDRKHSDTLRKYESSLLAIGNLKDRLLKESEINEEALAHFTSELNHIEFDIDYSQFKPGDYCLASFYNMILKMECIIKDLQRWIRYHKKSIDILTK